MLQGGRIIRIEEKPGEPKSRFAVIGIYTYDGSVFVRIRAFKRSARGECEIADVNNAYLAEGTLTYSNVSSTRGRSGLSHLT